MTDLERRWFEAGRRARRQLGLVPPPTFYALLAATRRPSTRQDPAEAGSCNAGYQPALLESPHQGELGEHST